MATKTSTPKIIGPKDASTLSLIAKRPSTSHALVATLSKEAKPIGIALTGGKPGNGIGPKSKTVSAARSLHKWGGSNVELNIRFEPVQKSGRFMLKRKMRKKRWSVLKSSKTGKFVSRSFAKSHPSTTFRERILNRAVKARA